MKDTMYELALCAGIGGISLGLRKAGFRTICYVEKNPYRVEVLKARIRDRYLDDAPIWDDLTTFDGKPWRGLVDILTAGFPCQPFSLAGERQGRDDERYLWPYIVHIIRHTRPRFILLENVPGLLIPDGDERRRRPAPFGDILADLASCGYIAQWQSLPAAAFGAPHFRDRVFVLAYDRQERIQRVFTRKISRVEEFSWCQNVRGIEDLRVRPDLPPSLFRGAGDGIPHWIQRLEAIGDAVVPPVAEYVGRCIMAASGVESEDVA